MHSYSTKWKTFALALGCFLVTSVNAGPIVLPTGPFIDTTLHDGSRNGAVGTLSNDGRYAVYDVDGSYVASDGGNRAVRDIVVFDRILGTVTQITYGDKDSYGATISADGRYVAFVSAATDFSLRNKAITVPDVDGYLTNPGPHVYVADLRTDLGKVTAPTTYHMVDTSVLDATTDCRAQAPLNPACSGGDGPASDAFISADGQYVAYASSALNIDGTLSKTLPAINRIYIWQRSTRTSRDITPQENGPSYTPTLSSDGSRLAFISNADNIVVTAVGTKYGGNAYLWDKATDTHKLVSANGLIAADGPSWGSVISADGQWVAYTTEATNLDTSDTNGQPDVYVYGVATGKSYGVSVRRLLGDCKDNGSEQLGSWGQICLAAAYAPTGGAEPTISANGRYIAFETASPLINQVGDTAACDQVDRNDRIDVYVADMANGGEITLQSMLKDETGKLWATPNGESRYASLSGDGKVLSFETTNAAFYHNNFEKIADPLYYGDGAPKVFLLNGLQRRSCP